MFSKRLLSLTREYRARFSLSIFFGWLGGALTILQAWFLAKLVNDVFLEHRTISQLDALLPMLLAVMVLKAVAAFLAEYTANQLSIEIRSGLRERLMQKIARLGPVYAGAERTGEISMTALDGIESLDAYFSQYLPQLALSASIPVTILLLVFPIDLLTGVVFVLTAPLIPFFMIMIGRYGETLTTKQYSSLSTLSAHFFDVLQGLTTLKVFGRSKKQTEVISEISDQYREVTMKVLRVTFISSLALELLATLSTAIVAVEIGLRLLYARMEFQPAFFILIIAPEFYFPLRQLGLKFHAGMTGVNAAVRVWEILDQPEPPPSPEKDIHATLAPSSGSVIRLKNVHYDYPGRESFQLRSINVELRFGMVTALVGKTGSGKSTIFNLLLRFAQPNTGTILLNDTPIDSIPVEQWRRWIAYVPQNPTLYYGSIKENLLFANPSASTRQIEIACQNSGLLPFIQSLPNGIETIVGERGSRLSGGQAQRLALARAFLKDAPILLLDEPSSNLDPQLEGDLTSSVKQMAKQKIVVLIAHSVKTALAADRIYVLDQGLVSQFGSPAELRAMPGLFAQLVSGQPSEASG